VKHWKVSTPDDGPAEELARQSFLPLPLARVLFSRGVTTAAEADRFLNPRLSDMGDPFRLPDMEKAVERIWKAIQDESPIVVYGDYDVDGVTSAALMSLVLTHLGARVTRHLPNRMEEGYGLGAEAVERFVRTDQPGLIITTDCGTGSHEAVAVARALGVDVVITDHHEVSDSPAAAVAVVNPKLGSDPSSRILAGVGVAFQVCYAVLKRGRERRRKATADLDLRSHLDLVALGTISDMVPMLHENRILVRHGLAQLNRRERKGLQALVEVAGAKGELGAYHVGFVLGPRINAAGRLGNAGDALELLLTGDAERAGSLAQKLDGANRDRKQIEKGIMDEAIRRIDADFDPGSHFGIVVGDAGWQVGVVGIVASRLANRYGRPAIVVGFDETGTGRGSCRSIEGFDLLSGLKRCSDYLARYGGHEMAAGLEVQREQFESFQKAFHEACADLLKGRDLRKTLVIDGWLSLPELLEPAFMDGVNRMAPFGEGNPEPVWGLKEVQVIGTPKVVGQAHLKMRVGVGGASCEAIGFNMADRLETFPPGSLDLAFTLRANTYLGRTTPQLHLQDFRGSLVSEA
jgi:single-stranded-DNA-specific exonuclease